MADIKSLQTLLAELRIYLRAKNRSLDVGNNSFTKDIVLTPYGVGGKLIMDEVETVKDLHVLSTLSGEDLDAEGTNYNIERLRGTYATVDLTFYANTKPTTDVTILATAQARTAGSAFTSPVVFTVDGETVFALADVDAYYSHDTGRWEFTVSATCDERGIVGIVGSNLIPALVTGITGINGVTNLTASVGGSDQEDDDSLQERIRVAKLGRCLNVAYGIDKYLRGLGFADSNTIRVEEIGYERATGVDAFVIDYSSQSTTDEFAYAPAQQRYYFSKRPIREVTSVVSETLGTLSASQYNVNVDSTSPLRRSLLAQDYIEFLAPPVPIGSAITVTYNYSSAINQAQETLDLPMNEVLTAELLVKRAYPLSLFLTATLTLKANADGPTTRNRVRNALAQYMSRYKLGDDVQKSDLIIVMQQGYGDYPVESVDAVVISSFYLQDEFGASYLPIDEIITVGIKQHAIYGSATVI